MASVLITGSAGVLGRALRAAFEAQGDVVWGIDETHSPYTDERHNLDSKVVPMSRFANPGVDILICNAKLRGWEHHDYMARHTRQCVINIASIYGVLGPDPALYDGTEVEPTPAYYAAAKGAMIALTRHQACTLAPVRSNCIILGGIFRGHSDLFRERYEAKVPLRRMATEADAVNAVMFLASEKSSYITGACLAVDGGLTAMA